jgi:hypothetical protein
VIRSLSAAKQLFYIFYIYNVLLLNYLKLLAMENLLINHRELDFVKHDFYKNVYNEFGIRQINFEVGNWEDLEWKDFKKVLLKLGAKIELENEGDWEQYFAEQKLKIKSIRKRLSPLKNAKDKKVQEEVLV